MYFASLARIPLLLVIFAHSDPARSTKLSVDTRIGTSVKGKIKNRENIGRETRGF
jgi:hypothetical protein